MPVSKNRKDHNKKVMQYKQKLALDRKRAQEALMKLYQEQQQYRQSQLKQQVNGVDVENADIDINAEDLAVVQEQAPVVEVAENVVTTEAPTFDVEEFSLPTEIPVEVVADVPGYTVEEFAKPEPTVADAIDVPGYTVEEVVTPTEQPVVVEEVKEKTTTRKKSTVKEKPVVVEEVKIEGKSTAKKKLTAKEKPEKGKEFIEPGIIYVPKEEPVVVEEPKNTTKKSLFGKKDIPKKK